VIFKHKTFDNNSLFQNLTLIPNIVENPTSHMHEMKGLTHLSFSSATRRFIFSLFLSMLEEKREKMSNGRSLAKKSILSDLRQYVCWRKPRIPVGKSNKK